MTRVGFSARAKKIRNQPHDRFILYGSITSHVTHVAASRSFSTICISDSLSAHRHINLLLVLGLSVHCFTAEASLSCVLAVGLP